MQILAHRGNIDGKNKLRENQIRYLKEAMDIGFDLEFDISFSLYSKKLILSHDEQEWKEELDVSKFLEIVPEKSFSALNIKNLDSVDTILEKLESSNKVKNFFLFDFELLTKELVEVREKMKQIQNNGFNIAFRLSEKEDYYKEYLNDKEVRIIWLDEFNNYWITPEILKSLRKEGKMLYYVSPELHQCDNMELIKEKWDMSYSNGVNGICTDFPSYLKKYIGEEL